MTKLGIVGWRGMVGSVLRERMEAENDFSLVSETHFFSTSQAGQPAPDNDYVSSILLDAHDLDALESMDYIISAQGGDYTKRVHPELRSRGWNGYWIDAASALRMNDTSTIVLDPMNREVIDAAIASGRRDFVGGNCTVSLMLMALGPLLQRDLVSWISAMTYQAASGAGAKNMRELLLQMSAIHDAAHQKLCDGESVLDIERHVSQAIQSSSFPVTEFGAPLAASLIPWIDRAMENGQTREEWKAAAEANKILDRMNRPVPLDGICVRVGALRSHSQALTICLKQDVSIPEIESILQENNPWLDLITNEKEATLTSLSPTAVGGTLRIALGRLRKLNIGENMITCFTVGDQLLWGAAEPLRRVFRILRNGEVSS